MNFETVVCFLEGQLVNFPTLIDCYPFCCVFETSVVFFAVARVLISVCWLFSVTAKKEPSKEEPKEKVKVRKLVTFRVNRSQNFRVVSAAGIIATLRCTESNGRQIHVTVHVC